MKDPARSDPDRAGNLIRLVTPELAPELSPALGPEPVDDGLVDSYRRLSDVYHDLLSEQSLDALLDRIADALAELIPYEALHVYEADEPRRELVPRLVRSEWADEILSERFPYGEGITGWAVEQREAVLANQAHLHPLVRFVPGTPVEPEALIVIPMIARGLLKGTFNIYRIGEDASFGEQEFELAKRFGDAAALALDNAHIRERLEHQAQTDSLTGLFNHRYFHERLRRELTRASGAQESVAVLMADIDDFKKVNDVYGHAVGDLVLAELADHLRATVRSTDVVCRIGGEEFAVIVPANEEAHAISLAGRLTQRLDEVELDVAGRISISIGVAHGPRHAANPRELVACAEAAMMTAKARGKSQVVLFGEDESERPGEPEGRRDDVRSIAHLKLLQSLVGKLNRLNGVREIGMAIANELRLLIDYHNCRIFLREGDNLSPIAFQGDLAGSDGAAFDVLATKVGDGFTGWVAEHGQSLLLPDAAKCELAVEIEGTHPIEESVIAVPLNLGSRVLGVIVVSKLGIGQLDDDDMRLLEVLAGHAAVALENARLYEAQKREAQSAHALLDFSRDLAAAEGLESVYARVVDGSARLLGAPHASLWLQELETGDLVCCAGTGYEDRSRLASRRFPALAIAPFTAQTEPYLLSPSEDAAFADPPAGGSGQFAIAPFSFDGRWGTIAVGSAEDSLYGQRELELLGGLAHQAKLALANATSFESLERTFLSTVEALANALEARDQYTSSHARWITDTALRVGQELGLDGDTLKRLELGALFHDIGKIGIPNSVLLKPGPLSDDERALIETHPELGARILAPIDQLEDVCSIVRACHERWDGRGYPDRKTGEEIPLEARIIFACDAFHAMTTDRPYRAKLEVEEALRRLVEAAGTQFDPQVVAVCVRLLEAPPSS
ncbi:MAG: diguanylate cyclase [Gaiellaceae bacterium]